MSRRRTAGLVAAAAVLAALYVGVVGCDTPTLIPVAATVVTVKAPAVAMAESIDACRDIVWISAADACVVTSGPDVGARVKPTVTDEHGQVTATTTVRERP